MSSSATGTRPSRRLAADRSWTNTNLLPQARIRELSELRGARVVADVAGAWACIVAAWIAVALFPTWWVVALAIPVIGTRYYALFIIGHDAMHRRLFQRRAMNDLFNDLFIFGAIGAITRLNNRNHLQHHHALGTEADPDRHKHACFNKIYHRQLLAFVTGLSSLLTSAGNVFLRRPAAKTESQPGPERTEKADRYTGRDLAIVLSWQILLLGGLTWAIGWWAYPVLWLAPLYVFTFLGDNLRTFLEHAHTESDELADQHRLVTYSSNFLELLLVAPMNMNFHTVHHLWPSIPYYNLPQADRELRATAPPADFTWRKSYLGYLLHYFRSQPLLECAPAETIKA